MSSKFHKKILKNYFEVFRVIFSHFWAIFLKNGHFGYNFSIIFSYVSDFSQHSCSFVYWKSFFQRFLSIFFRILLWTLKLFFSISWRYETKLPHCAASIINLSSKLFDFCLFSGACKIMSCKKHVVKFWEYRLQYY